MFIDNQFDRIQNTQRALQMIKRFEKLDLPNLGMQDKYARILNHYAKDIETVSKIYQKSRLQPPIARDLPPIAGKILWVRQLYRRINYPMSVFEANKTILQYPEAKKIIKNYNQMSAVLVEYEVLYHRTWLRQVELVLSGIHASLIVKHPETSEYFVNFDPEIMTLIRETECMKRLNLQIPPEAENLVVRQEVFKDNFDRLKLIVEEYRRIKTSVPAAYEQLLVPRFQQLDQVIMPGCLSMTWVSPNIDEYCDNVFKELENMDLVLKRANDLVVYRIEAVLNDITNIALNEINEDEPMSVEEFLQRTEELCELGASSIQSKSSNIEEATEELIELLYPDYKSNNDEHHEEEHEEEKEKEESDEVKNSVSAIRSHDGTNRSATKVQLTAAQLAAKRKREARIAMQETAHELFNFFNHKNSDAIVKLVRSTLEKIRKRINASQAILSYNDAKDKTKKEVPVFKGYAVLAIPAIVMQPSLDEIQHALNKSVQIIINVSKHVMQWTKGRKVAAKRKDTLRKDDLKELNGEGQSSTADLANGDADYSERPGSPNTSIVAQKNYYKSVSENKDIAKMVSLLSTCISSTKKDIITALDKFKGYQFIWQKDREEDLKEFIAQDPRVSEFEAKIKSFVQLINEINAYKEYVPVGSIALVTEKLKMGLTSEIQLWKTCYGQACNLKYKKEINEISLFIEDVFKRLQREIKDLDDIRLAMAALKELRDNEIRIDMTIVPVEECYAMLQKHEIEVPREEIEKCDTLRYNWQKLLQMASQTSGTLLEIQPLYKDGLKSDVKDFIIECDKFYNDYKKVRICFFLFYLSDGERKRLFKIGDTK